MHEFDDHYKFIPKKILSSHSDPILFPIHACDLNADLLKNLKLLKLLIQSEKVKESHFNNSQEPSQTIRHLQDKVIHELYDYNIDKLASFSIPQEYFEDFYELFIAAWRKKVHNNYAKIIPFKNLTFSPQSFRAFIIAASLNVTLSALQLENCSLGEPEIKMLCMLIKVHPTLEHLNLSHNRLEEHSMSLLSHALKDNSTIMDLNLAQTEMSDKGAYNLIGVIKQGKLKTLNIEKNSFKKETIEALEKAARQNLCDLIYDDMLID